MESIRTSSSAKIAILRRALLIILTITACATALPRTARTRSTNFGWHCRYVSSNKSN